MRKFFLVVAGVLLLIIAGLELFIYVNRPIGKEALRERAAQLPDLSLTTLDGKNFTLPTDRPAVLVYFNSECDHCQREIANLTQHLDLFTGSVLVLMSAESPEIISSYLRTLTVTSNNKLFVVHVRHEVIAEKFGLLGLPQIFIYSADGQLIDLFSGETQTEIIAKSLPR